ncbi:MAG: hypothetical protein OQJ89_04720 [Kangiellaceae bacterium]|nr:hypothetical protein [Kangiellaceae bacterium]MCW8997212.1 hypothetical protein [Kangiellaceae bacterium]MCW9016246.1 hypothetical protein [Kangiellaceae bacterium]
MRFLKLFSLTVGILLLVGNLDVSAKTTSRVTLPAIELQNLFAEQPVVLKSRKDNLLFVTFFEDKCRWCLRQMVAYEEFKTKINADFVMVGVGDSKLKLRHWAKRAGTSIPTAYASDKLLALVGKPEVTPYTLIFDSEGHFLTKVTGYIKPGKLSQLSANFASESS